MNQIAQYELYRPPAPSGAFPNFPKLPIELRHKIFKEHQEEEPGRLIEVKWSKTSHCYYVDAPVPPLLHLCHDSRVIAMKHFELLTIPVRVSIADSMAVLFTRLNLRLPNPFHSPSPQVCLFRVYHNFNIDILYFSSYHFESGEYGDHDQGVATKLKEFLLAVNLRNTVASRLRIIAFNAEYFNAEVFGQCMYNMKNLEYVHLVFNDSCCASERFSHGRGRPHKMAVSIEQIKIPDVPSVQPAPPPLLTNPTVNFPGVPATGPASAVALPIHLMPGFPYFNANVGLMAQLSPEDQRKVQIQEHWVNMDDELTTILEENVADVMAYSNGHAREDWSNLITQPAFVTRVPVRSRI